MHNPHGVLYGRIPGYGLSELGHRMADAAARALEEEGAPVNRVIPSPLQRAQESAAPWAERFALEVATDERVIEPTNRFEGSKFPSPARIARSPRLWPLVVDPVKPSWGESYRSIAARMAEAVKAAYRSVPDGDVVIVSHQLPIWMVAPLPRGRAPLPRPAPAPLRPVEHHHGRARRRPLRRDGLHRRGRGARRGRRRPGGGLMPGVSRRSILAAAASSVLAAVALSGCTEDPLAAEFKAGDNKRYIAGDGTFTEIPLAERAAPVDFSGTLSDGTEISSADYRGSVTVLNFWYAECPPCRLEAKDLQAASEEHAADGVRFLGVNTRDQRPNVDSFDKTYGITYPSVLDVEDTSMQLAFAGTIAPNAVPATIVLDRQGRVASRVLGQIDPGVLRTLVKDTVAEAAG